jgi:signal transduction histidine kinase
MSVTERSDDFATSSLDVQEAELGRLARRWLTLLRALFIALAALTWLAFLEDTSHEHRYTMRAVAERDANLATAIEHYAVRVVRTAAAVHRLMGTYLSEGMDAAQLERALADRLLANDVFDELGLCPRGQAPLRAARAQPRLDASLCARLQALGAASREVSVLHAFDERTDELRIALVLPVAGETLAVGLLKPDAMLGVMQSARLRADTVVLLSGADGSPRAAWHSQRKHVVRRSDLDALRSLAASGDGVASVGGRDYLVSSRLVAGGGLRIQVATAQDDALAGFRARRARLLLMSTLVTLALAGVYLVLARMHREGQARAEALRSARAELQLLNADLDRQVQERTSELQRANQDLETFSYAVAHDVRSPLASIAGFAEAMRPGVQAAGDDKLRHYLQRIQSNAAHLDTLTGHLLQLGHMSHAPLRPRMVDLSHAAHEVVAQLREREPGRDVDVTIAPNLRAWGDPTMLREILENLLGNAWKFSARRAQARIAFAPIEPQLPGEAVFVVEDNGDGFDSDAAPGLFQPFRRMHGRDEFPGTGVGLAAVHRILARHGGRVWCEARRGEGARFVFALPAADPRGTGASARDV